jgi:hypothetical protein
LSAGVVDRLAQQAGGLEPAGIAEPGTVQRGAHDEFAHVAAGGERLEPGHAVAGIGRGVGDRDVCERLQGPGIAPER